MKMHKIILLSLMLCSSLAFSQRWQGRSSMGNQNPANAPKIGEVYGTVVDSVSGIPIPYASVSIVNTRSNTILTGGITYDEIANQLKQNALLTHNNEDQYKR